MSNVCKNKINGTFVLMPFCCSVTSLFTSYIYSLETMNEHKYYSFLYRTKGKYAFSPIAVI